MDTSSQIASLPAGLFAAGPVHLLGWSEEPGRPLTSNSSRFLARVGGERHEVLASLDRLASEAALGALGRALAGARAAGRGTCEVESFEVDAGAAGPAWFHLTVQLPLDGTEHVATAVDITASRRIEDELAMKSERLELVLEGTRLGMWDWNPGSGAVSFNERWAEMLGHALAEVEPSLAEWESRVHPDDLAACYADIQAHIEGRVPFYENIHRMRHADGHWVYILDRGKVVERDADGAPVRFTGTHTDITAQKRAELDARAAADAKSAFLAMMSHEIRTPLNGILGLLQVAEGAALDDEQREVLGLMGQSGEHLLHLINDILDLSKVEAGELTLDPAPFDATAMSRSVVGLYAQAAAERRVALSVTPGAGEERWVIADGHRLRQVLTNLVSNAVKFTEEGTVEVTVDVVGEGTEACLVLAVQDTGTGIADPSGVFEAFRQEDASISRSHGGTGLGLAICRSILDLMGGDIELESEVGVGSRFEVRVPVQRCERPADAGEQVAATRRANLAELRVLVADDNAVNRRVARGMCARLGLEPTLVDDGAEAVAACSAQDFDLVLMDLHMPGLDGLEATRRILSGAGAAPVVVALSADVSRESLELCRQAGMRAFLGKPFRLAELEALLHDWAPAPAPGTAEG